VHWTESQAIGFSVACSHCPGPLRRFLLDWVSLLSARGSPASGSRPALPLPEFVELGLIVTDAHPIWFESVGSNGPPRSDRVMCYCLFASVLQKALFWYGFLWVLGVDSCKFSKPVCLESPAQKTRGDFLNVPTRCLVKCL
jgi:hypothetical protein